MSSADVSSPSRVTTPILLDSKKSENLLVVDSSFVFKVSNKENPKKTNMMIRIAKIDFFVLDGFICY